MYNSPTSWEKCVYCQGKALTWLSLVVNTPAATFYVTNYCIFAWNKIKPRIAMESSGKNNTFPIPPPNNNNAFSRLDHTAERDTYTSLALSNPHHNRAVPDVVLNPHLGNSVRFLHEYHCHERRRKHNRNS